MILKREAISEISTEKKTSRKSSLSNTLRFWQNSIWRSISFPESNGFPIRMFSTPIKRSSRTFIRGLDKTARKPRRILPSARERCCFAHPDDAKPAVEHALRMGQDRKLMADRLGEVMGYLAYGHPFLDGNGRTILAVHVELAERAGISVDWAATDKAAYLTALTRELNNPGKGHLDAYLKPFVGPAIGREPAFRPRRGRAGASWQSRRATWRERGSRQFQRSRLARALSASGAAPRRHFALSRRAVPD